MNAGQINAYLRLFFGEGPWAHVPVEHEMSGDGVGENYDGAHGVVVDSDGKLDDVLEPGPEREVVVAGNPLRSAIPLRAGFFIGTRRKPSAP